MGYDLLKCKTSVSPICMWKTHLKKRTKLWKTLITDVSAGARKAVFLTQMWIADWSILRLDSV